jgi:hypothetical protein
LVDEKLRPVGGDLLVRIMDGLERFFVGMAIVGFVGLFLTVGLSMYSPH